MSKADFRDEEDVLAEVAAALGEDPEDLEIEEDSGLTSFGEGVVYQVSSGNREWQVVEDDDAAEELAKAVVRQDLENEPEIFEKGFIESHIDEDKLRDALRPDVTEFCESDLREMSPYDFWRTAGHYIDLPDDDEETGELPDPEDFIEEVAEKMAEERLKDPLDYLEDIYGADEAAEQAIKIAGFDVDAAMDDAVSTDGWQHFLARYDGNSDETKSGFVFWRSN